MAFISGSIVALATPFTDDGSIDALALKRLIDWHIAEGTNCICVVGTTGESPTVSVDEHCEIIRIAVEQAKGRVPIMAGAGANATSEAIELTRYAKSVGAKCTSARRPTMARLPSSGNGCHLSPVRSPASTWAKRMRR